MFMIANTYTFECITPCFCAGADQTKAEIRASSIRGALRWWFRALGDSKELETEVFGGADPVAASSVLIRVSKITSRAVGRLPQPQGIDPLSYILYFPSVSSDRTRWNDSACYGPGTTFQIHLKQLRKLSPLAEQRLNDSILAFRHFGSIGMHVTRGLGAVQCSEANAESWKRAIELIEYVGFTYRQSDKPHKIWDAVLKEAGQWLQNDLRKEFGAGGNKKPAQATALGSALPVRQTSAVYLRPIKQTDVLFFAAFEAPHNRVLGSVSKTKHTQPILQSRDFTKTPPQAPQKRR
jgi:CRISPR type III-B/RAMP module RAMP protein Cmr1